MPTDSVTKARAAYHTLPGTKHTLVVPAPSPRSSPSPANLRAQAVLGDSPVATHVVTPSIEVTAPVPGQPSRRVRRAADRAAKPRQIGGGYCPCNGVTDFYNHDDRENWTELHQDCDEITVPA